MASNYPGNAVRRLLVLSLLPCAFAGCVIVVPSPDETPSRLPFYAVVRKAGAVKNEDMYFSTLALCYEGIGRMGNKVQVIEGCQSK